MAVPPSTTEVAADQGSHVAAQPGDLAENQAGSSWVATIDEWPAAAKRAFDAMMEMTKIDIAVVEAARRG